MSPGYVVYVVVYPSHVFAAHWSLWIPYHHTDAHDGTTKESELGDRIHVTGDRLNGHQYEYIRNYSPSADKRHPDLYAIGRVQEKDVISYNDNNDTAVSTDHKGIDEWMNGNISSSVVNKLDETCREVEAPGPSLNPVVTTVSRGAAPPLGPPPPKKEARDCQWWIRKVVGHLVESGLLMSIEEGDEARTPSVLVGNLPRH